MVGFVVCFVYFLVGCVDSFLWFGVYVVVYVFDSFFYVVYFFSYCVVEIFGVFVGVGFCFFYEVVDVFWVVGSVDENVGFFGGGVVESFYVDGVGGVYVGCGGGGCEICSLYYGCCVYGCYGCYVLNVIFICIKGGIY